MSPAARGSLRSGLDALAQWKLILLLAAATAVLGLLSTTPLAPTLQDVLAGTLAGDHFLRNAPTFAPTDFLDFFREHGDAIQGMRRTSGAAGALGILLQVFLAGGIVAVLGRGRFTFGQFLEPARRNAVHNAKCLGLFVAALAVVLGGGIGGAVAASAKLFENAPPGAPGRVAAYWGIGVIGLLLFAILSLVYDFARAARRYAPTIGAWRSVRFALRVLRGGWLRALGLFLVWFLLGTLAVLAGIAAVWEMPAVSLPAVLLLFGLELAALGLRAAVRVAAWGSYLGFLDPRARRALSTLSF